MKLSTAVFVAAIAGGLWSSHVFAPEGIPINHGLGWDGTQYASWARDFSPDWLDKQKGHRFDRYYAQRWLPSAVAHYALELAGMPWTHANIRRVWTVINIVLIASVVLNWGRCADVLGIGWRGKWLGVCLVAVNFFATKFLLYYPCLTDFFAFAVAGAMVRFYLTDRPLLLWAATFVGAFCWPISLHVGAILLLLPRGSPSSLIIERSRFVPFILLGVGVWLLVAFGPGTVLPLKITHGVTASGWPTLRPFSALLVGAYCAIGAGMLLNWRPRLTLDVSIARVALVAALFVAVHALFGRATSGAPAPLTPLIFGGRVLFLSSTMPGIFLVAHVVVWGPFWLLLMSAWPAVARQIRQQGTGMTCAALFALALSLGSESRQLAGLVPLLIPATVQAVRGDRWSAFHLIAFTALCLAMSRVWLEMNAGTFGLHWQEYWSMVIGWRMTPFWYTRQLAAAIAIGVVVYFVFVRPHQQKKGEAKT